MSSSGCFRAPLLRRSLLAGAAAMTALAVMPLAVVPNVKKASALDTLKPVAMPSPKTRFLDPNDNPMALADFKPMPLVINFWATWCPPCVDELPSLARLHRYLEERGMAVLLVGIDKGGAEIGLPFLEKENIRGPLLGFDAGGKLATAFGLRVLPTTYVVRSDGVIVAKFEGDTEWDSPAMIERLWPFLTG